MQTSNNLTSNNHLEGDLWVTRGTCLRNERSECSGRHHGRGDPIHAVAVGDPFCPIMVMGSPTATSSCIVLPVVMMATSLRSIAIITTGYSEAHPLGESPSTSRRVFCHHGIPAATPSRCPTLPQVSTPTLWAIGNERPRHSAALWHAP